MANTRFDAPALGVRIAAVDELADLGLDEDPAGAGALDPAGRAVIAAPHGIDDAPADDAVDQLPQDVERDDGQKRVAPRREQVAAEASRPPRSRSAAGAWDRTPMPAACGAHIRGGSRCMAAHLSTSAMRALNQFMNSEVSRLRLEIDEHGDQDHLHRLPGLVQHRAGEHADEIGIGDGDSQRGVLDQVEIVARQRRNDDAHGLRDDHEAQRLAWREADGDWRPPSGPWERPGCRRGRSRR